MNTELVLRSILLGAGLAMDAFSVSLADGLGEPQMDKARMTAIAGTFGGFQTLMPLAGWLLVRTAVSAFAWLERFVPWIALMLLLYIGGGMLREGIRDRRGGGAAPTPGPAAKAAPRADASALTLPGLLLQGVATSIDALSVGFTIERYELVTALSSVLIIGAVTMAICFAGLAIGKKAGTALAGRASILGGIILIAIGLEIWAKGIFF